jgi:ankyrin repeat protein
MMIKKRFENLLQAIVLVALLLFSAASVADSFVRFFRAVNVDDARTVTRLLNEGFDPNAVNTQGQPALVQALRDESPRVVEVLLAHPQLRLDATTAADETALMMAALAGQLGFVKQLAERGAQINREGWTPLHYAASSMEPPVVAYLLQRGALVDAPSPNRTTPLMMAARYGVEDSALLLLQRGADTTLRNDQGLSAADFARAAGRERLAERLQAARPR